MTLRPTIFALLCVAGWLAGALHESLEAADWMPGHHHHGHAHHEHTSDDHSSHESEAAGEEHPPVWARDLGRVLISALAGLGLGLFLFTLWLQGGLVQAAHLVSGLRQGGPPLRVNWQFGQRCAAFATAPPLALN